MTPGQGRRTLRAKLQGSSCSDETETETETGTKEKQKLKEQQKQKEYETRRVIICNTESKLANASLVAWDFMILDHCGYTLHALLTLIKSAVSLRRESMSLSCNSLRHRSYCSMLYSVIWDHGRRI